MHVKRIHHVTVAVRDLDTARRTFETLFGMSSGDATTPPGLGVRSLDLVASDGAALQLVASLEPDGPVMRFIQRRGEGVYSVAMDVDDLDGAIAELRERGIRVSDPAELSPGMRSAFVASTAAHGVSVQLIEASLIKPAAEQPLDLTPDEWPGGN